APTQSDQDLSRREEMTVSSAAMSAAPWGAATVTGGVIALGDLGLHVIGGHIGLSALSGWVAFGAVAFFVVAAAGALWRARPSRAIRGGRWNSWRFPVLPAPACAALALVLSVVTRGVIITPEPRGLDIGGNASGREEVDDDGLGPVLAERDLLPGVVAEQRKAKRGRRHHGGPRGLTRGRADHADRGQRPGHADGDDCGQDLVPE